MEENKKSKQRGKSKRRGKETKTNSGFSVTNPMKEKIFGANTLQLNEDANIASRLIGSIVEKGIHETTTPSSSTPPPKVSVLPFPVARHRSHGPHWGPMTTEGDQADGSDEEEEDDDLISAFANPVERKKKKGLDLSQWRELFAGGNKNLEMDKNEGRPGGKRFGEQKKDERADTMNWTNVSERASLIEERPTEAMSTDMSTAMEIDSSNPLEVQENSRGASSGIILGEAGPAASLSSYNVVNPQVESMVDMDLELEEILDKRKINVSTITSTSNFNNFGNEQESMSLESEIDAENRARLLNMTSEEITEARAEIMEKMNPTVVSILKRRGLEKLKKKSLPGSNMANNTNEQRAMSLESDIDVENRTRLEKMTPEEIAEAQAEIMEKMNPKLVNVLKMRGEEKLKNSSATPGSNHLNEHQYGEALAQLGSGVHERVTKLAPTDGNGGPGDNVVQNMGSQSGSLWKNWSERVEAVRKLRFSLEGTVVTEQSGTGIASTNGIHSVDNVAERDFLRTEGDPGEAGYTIKEAVQLTRSVIPGQRAIALHLLSSVLNRAIHNIGTKQVGSAVTTISHVDNTTDWEAIWAYALGPEPELVLSLRMCLDDNHSSVVFACTKVIECVLTCDLNESFFEVSEEMATHEENVFTAPVFRSKPDVDGGFLRGGFWKYSAKPTNIMAIAGDVIDEEIEGEHTIQDDIVFAGQDFAAGLVRMGILIRIRYLLEGESHMALDECIISLLIAIARHSPTCADAIMKCPKLVQTVVQRFNGENSSDIHSYKIKSVRLLRVLAQCNKKNCIEFIRNGSFHVMTWHLFRKTSSLDQWMKSGKENCIFSSALMVEQLRFWKVCIWYGNCISYFPEIFPSLCLWLNPPAFDKLETNNVVGEFASIASEAYLVLDALAQKLPNIHSHNHQSCRVSDFDEQETWSWSYVAPMVDLAIKWIASGGDPNVRKYFEPQSGKRSETMYLDLSSGQLLLVYSSIMHMLSSLLDRVYPKDAARAQRIDMHVPWLPEFVPKIGLEIIKNGFLSFSNDDGVENGEHCSLVQQLCHLRQQGKNEMALASVSCLHGLLKAVKSIDNLIQSAKNEFSRPSQECSTLEEGEVLKNGILESCPAELTCLLDIFMEIGQSEWHITQSVEIFGRGGLTPGVGLGWGAPGGGFWSTTVLLAQTDSRLLIDIIDTYVTVFFVPFKTEEGKISLMEIINSVLGVCLTAGPRDRVIVKKAFEFLLSPPLLMYLNTCIRRWLIIKEGTESIGWAYKEQDISLCSETLRQHLYDKWLSFKGKSKAADQNDSSGNNTSKKGRVSLETIHEDMPNSDMTRDASCYTLAVEWARQRLPLPSHWFLSPISTFSNKNVQDVEQDPSDVLELSKSGLFFLLGLETMSTLQLSDVPSPVRSVPLVWKLHSLSATLLVGMGVLEDDKSRGVYKALQDLYGQVLDEARLLPDPVFLGFQSEIHESYSTFIETLVEQFAAESYGDLIFGRQVALYLHCSSEASVRLIAWNTLTSAHVLEILPPLEKCVGGAAGYLEPVEDNESILEAYVKAWVSGALDKAATRASVAFTLVLHHISCFIFGTSDKISLRNKLVNSLLRDYSQKQKHEGMMLKLLRYDYSQSTRLPEEQQSSMQECSAVDIKFQVLAEACDSSSSLLTVVEKLKSAFGN